jgi:hypothetical protein
MSKALLTGLGLLALGLVLWGCDGDDGGSLDPVIGVDVSPGSATVVTGRTRVLTVTVTGGDDSKVDWYVNDILGGNSEVGTIVVASPATYTAPDTVPDPSTVVVKAISRESSSEMDSCLVTVTPPLAHVYVGASEGDDETGDGGSSSPLRSITTAFGWVAAGGTIHVAEGVYDADHGEVFPLAIPDSVLVEGEDWENTIIRGFHDGEHSRYGIQIEGKNSALRRFTIEEGVPDGREWRIGVYVDNAENAVLDSIRILERAAEAVMRVWYSSNTRIENCVLAIDDGKTEDHGIEFNCNYCNTIVRNCLIRGFATGIALNNYANPLIEGCVIEDNRYGLSLCCTDQENHNPNPDLGGGARGSLGGNTIQNRTCGIRNGSTNALYAKFNTWNNSPPVEGDDFCNLTTGSVIWE